MKKIILTGTAFAAALSMGAATTAQAHWADPAHNLVEAQASIGGDANANCLSILCGTSAVITGSTVTAVDNNSAAAAFEGTGLATNNALGLGLVIQQSDVTLSGQTDTDASWNDTGVTVDGNGNTLSVGLGDVVGGEQIIVGEISGESDDAANWDQNAEGDAFMLSITNMIAASNGGPSSSASVFTIGMTEAVVEENN